MTGASSSPRCFIIGEVAGAHDGSFLLARAHIDVIAAAGCDAVKFQIHLPEAESTPAEAFRVPIPGYRTRQEYWARTGFREDQWLELAAYAAGQGLEFMATPFSVAAVEMLQRLGVKRWKVSSGEVGNVPLLRAMAATGLPVILSTGMSGFADVAFALEHLRTGTPDLTVCQCTTRYPTAAEQVGLNVLGEIRRRLGVKAGLSDHSGTIFPGIVAAYLGCDVLEVHACMSRQMQGPDMPASLDPQDLADLVRGVRFAEAMGANPVDKDATRGQFDELRDLFTQGIYVARPVTAGAPLGVDDLEVRKPGTGLPASQWDAVLGRPAARDLVPGHPLAASDLA